MASKRFATIGAAACLLMLSAVGIATALTQSTFGKQTSFHGKNLPFAQIYAYSPLAASGNFNLFHMQHVAPSVSDFQNGSDVPRRNVIMMISDGFGPASETYSRTYFQYLNSLPFDHMLPLDTIHVGQSRTRSASSLVTDSAAGATAFSCAMKSYNGAIAGNFIHLSFNNLKKNKYWHTVLLKIDPNFIQPSIVNVDKEPCGTVLESAKIHHDMLTGLVVTSRITHATPASFSAHVVDRDMEDQIANQQIGDNPLGRTVDLMFGGGICHFLPNTTDGSCRSDDVDLWNVSTKKYGWKTVLRERTDFDKLSNTADLLPLIGLFTPDVRIYLWFLVCMTYKVSPNSSMSMQHMSYEIDRNNDTEPSLLEMSEKALGILKASTANSDKGFFLMIEGSRIDMAAHS